MIVVNPFSITDAHITASNLAATDNPDYSAVTTYNTGDLVTYNAQNFECLDDSVTGIAPDSDSLKWLNLGAVNRLKLFDGKNLSLTVGTPSISYSLLLGQVGNALALINCDAASVDVVVNDPIEGEVFNKTYSMVDYSASDLYEYFFTEVEYKTVLVINDLPPYKNATLSITIHERNAQTPARVGTLVYGRQQIIGDLKFNYGVGIEDYSEVSFDPFGEVEIIERGYADTAELPVSVPTKKIHSIKQRLAAYRAKKMLWIGNITRPETVVFGIYQSFSLVIPNAIESDCSISLKGVI